MAKSSSLLKECKYHGKLEFRLEGRGAYRCPKCRSERVSRDRRKLKDEALNFLGGKCSICGYSKSKWALEFHHLENKEHAIAFLIRDRKRNLLFEEIQKCILVCSNCHQELEEQKYLGTVAE